MKSDYQKIFIGLAVLLGLFQVGQFAFSRQKTATSNNVISPALLAVKRESADNTEASASDGRIYGGILPHNLAVQGSIERFLKQFGDKKIGSIVLLAPNHLAHGSHLVATIDEAFTFDNRPVPIDNGIKEGLLASGKIKIDNRAVANELSVGALMPLLIKYFPQAKCNIVIFKNQPNEGNGEAIAEALAQVRADKDTLVLATVDFSHYLPKAVADFHDEQSRAAIENFNYEKVLGAEIDSPAVLMAALKYFEKLGYRPQLVDHSNTASLTGNDDAPSTSHFIYAFSKGERAGYKQASVLFFGDMMLDRYVGEIIGRKGFDFLLAKLKGDESRFFAGSDFVGANLEGAVTERGEHAGPALSNDFAFKPGYLKSLQKYNFNIFNLANNHLSDQGAAGEASTRRFLGGNGLNYFGCRNLQIADCSAYITHKGSTSIAWLGFSQVYGKLDRQKMAAKIRQAKNGADFAIVNVHWGSEYQSSFDGKQQDLAHAMIDAGADVVIGHHPHVVQGIETYKNKPIFYSLGNFIFDQYFSTETQQGLALGLDITEQRIKAYLFPLDLAKSQPKLMAGGAKKRKLGEIAAVSGGDTALRERIKAGYLEISQDTK